MDTVAPPTAEHHTAEHHTVTHLPHVAAHVTSNLLDQVNPTTRYEHVLADSIGTEQDCSYQGEALNVPTAF